MIRAIKQYGNNMITDRTGLQKVAITLVLHWIKIGGKTSFVKQPELVQIYFFIINAKGYKQPRRWKPRNNQRYLVTDSNLLRLRSRRSKSYFFISFFLVCECGCYRARRISFHLFIYSFIYLCLFFFLCFGTRIFFCHTLVSFYSTYVPLFNSNKNNKAGKSTYFFLW